MPNYKLQTVRVPRGFVALAIAGNGLSSFTAGTYPTRLMARRALEALMNRDDSVAVVKHLNYHMPLPDLQTLAEAGR